MKKLLCIAGLLAAVLFVNVADASVGSPMRHGIIYHAPVATVHVAHAPVARAIPVRHHGFHGRRLGFHGRHFGFRGRHFGFRGRRFGFRGRRFGHRGFRGRRFGFCTRCGR